MKLRLLVIALFTPLFVVSAHADQVMATARVQVFASGENGIFANAYIVETSHHLVVIDSTLLESTSTALHEQIVALGKPL